MYALGKLPYEPKASDFKLSTFSVALPAYPKSPFGYGNLFADWEMLGNDQAGDCVFAGAAHEHDQAGVSQRRRRRAVAGSHGRDGQAEGRRR